MNLPARTRNMRELTRVIFFESDTTTIRLLLASASLLYALFLGLNVMMGAGVMERPAYELFVVAASIIGINGHGASAFWAVIFLLHFLGVVWRLYDLRQCDVCAFIVNAYGFMIWFASTLMLNISVRFLGPGTALEWTLTAASLWALWRTARVPEIATS